MNRNDKQERLDIPPDTETSRTIIVRLKAPTHKALRIRVAELDTSIQQYVEDLIEGELGIRPRTGAASGKYPKTIVER